MVAVEGNGRSGFLPTLWRVALVMGVYLALEWWILRVGTLPAKAYEGASIAGGLLRNFLGLANGLPLLAVIGFLAWRPRWLAWDGIEHGRAVRGFVVLVTAILAWTFSTYDVNLYVGRVHRLRV